MGKDVRNIVNIFQLNDVGTRDHQLTDSNFRAERGRPVNQPC